MIETPEQVERAEEASAKMKQFLLTVRRTHTTAIDDLLARKIYHQPGIPDAK